MARVLEGLEQLLMECGSSDRCCTWPDAFAHSTILLITVKIGLEDQSPTEEKS
jgi:hypothetical protein